jgi:hypothetical protein
MLANVCQEGATPGQVAEDYGGDRDNAEERSGASRRPATVDPNRVSHAETNTR